MTAESRLSTSAVRSLRFEGPDGVRIRGHYAAPEGEGPHPGVIVIHEIFGLNGDMKEKVARFASMGYAAFAPDLYSGGSFKVLCIARTMRQLNSGTGEAFDLLEASRHWLAARPEVDGERLGIIGFCMGGGFALLAAGQGPFGAAAAFYGALPKDRDRLDEACPVVAGYGGKDKIFGKLGPELEAELEQRNVPNDVVVYPDAGHSYMSNNRGWISKLNSWGPMRVGFNPEAAEDSWARVGAFFEEHLRG